jgi:DNA polymerase I-like protein with 3'-5' exonuclease and polymerase domains
MGNVDLRQAESRGIGYLAGDTAYIKACEGGDLHTAVAMLVYQDIEWPNSSNSQKRMAEEKFYRHFSRRDLAKRGGHLTNYYGKQQGVADAMQVSLSVGAEFQRGYKKAFPGIPAYHHWVQQQLGRHGQLTTPLGRTRTFLGRSSSEETLREAIAYGPQSLIVDIVDIALLKVFMTCYPMIQLQTQTHDSISFQFLEADEAEAIVAVEKCFEIDIDITGIDKIKRTMHIPTESKTGWNLGKYSTENPDGLKDYHGRDERRRQRPAQIPVLDWRFLKSDYLPSLSTSL